MSQPIADDFISELSSTIKEYEARKDAPPEFASLLEVSAHMLEALNALKSNLPKTGKPQPAA